MNEWIDWISQNREWLFSGAGVFAITTAFAVIGGLIAIFRRRATPSIVPVEQESLYVVQAQETEKTLNIVSDIVIPSPLIILDEIRKRPLLQQKAAEEHFLGVKVSWTGPLSSISESKFSFNLKLFFFDRPGREAFVEFDVPKDKHPGIGLLYSDTPIHVTGVIRRINVTHIYLSKAEIFFPSKDKPDKRDDMF